MGEKQLYAGCLSCCIETLCVGGASLQQEGSGGQHTIQSHNVVAECWVCMTSAKPVTAGRWTYLVVLTTLWKWWMDGYKLTYKASVHSDHVRAYM